MKSIAKKILKSLLPDPFFQTMVRIRSRVHNKHLVRSSPNVIFSKIYQENYWGGNSVSGMGSELQQTESLRSRLPFVLKKYSITSLLDAPCGDFGWMKHVDLSGINYIGGDIVPLLVDANRKKYSSGNRSFTVINLITDNLPKAEMLLCRDCLIHFSIKDIQIFIMNLKKSGIPLLLTTTYPNIKKNGDILTGDFRALNLRISPFHFPEPMEVISEDPFVVHQNNPNFIREMALWRVNDL
jgi:hypothetical protein